MTTEYKRTCAYCGSDEDRPHDPWGSAGVRNWLGEYVETGHDYHTSCEAGHRMRSDAFNEGYHAGRRNALAEARAKMRSVFGGDPDDANIPSF